MNNGEKTEFSHECTYGDGCSKILHGENMLIGDSSKLSNSGINPEIYTEDSVFGTVLRSEQKVLSILEKGCRCIKERQIQAVLERILKKIPSEFVNFRELIINESGRLVKNVMTDDFWDDAKNVLSLKYVFIIEHRMKYLLENEIDEIEKSLLKRKDFRLIWLVSEILKLTSYRGKPPVGIIGD